MARKINPPKLGSPLTPGDVDPSTGVTLFEQQDDPEDGDWGARIKTVGLTFDINPALLLDMATRAVLIQTPDAIRAGQKPDGSGPLKKLGKRAASVPNREGGRGFATGELVDRMKRTATRISKGVARSRIVPPPSRNAYVAAERERGTEMITTKGDAGKAAYEAIKLGIEAIMTGRKVEHDTADVEAKDVEP